MFPGEILDQSTKIWSQLYFDVEKGDRVLQMKAIVEYNGPSGSDQYCDQQQYAPQIHRFVESGNACD
jgi:hypothetical protein